jgi:hypothetical protein
MKSKKIKISGIITCLVFYLMLVGNVSYAQAPATKISGPLIAYADGSNITITSQIVLGSESPQITYSLSDNTSGAYIVSQGAYNYDPQKDEGTQAIVVNPGNAAGNFTIILEVHTPQGDGKSSKSVSVVRSNPTDGSN